jgi:type IV fimbrial biogenesis protein FimT
MFTLSPRARGMTLIELLASLAIGCILFAVAVPNLTTLVQNTRRTTLLNQFVGALQLARIESAERGRVVVLCASADGSTCGTESDWNSGWIVFANLDAAIGQRDVATEPLLQVYTVGKSQKVSVNIAGGASYFQLRPFDSRSSNGTITVCDARGAPEARAVVVGVMGRPYVSLKDGSKHALVCA